MRIRENDTVRTAAVYASVNLLKRIWGALCTLHLRFVGESGMGFSVSPSASVVPVSDVYIYTYVHRYTDTETERGE